jgi:hypothetical protein
MVAASRRCHIKQKNHGRCLEMLKAIAAGVAIAVGFGGAVMAQPARTPLPADPAGVLLVKHDKEDNGHGRKLGHYKQRGGSDENDDEGRSRRSSARSRTNNYYAPYYNGPPGYGSSYPAPYYAPYYRGY